MSNQSRMESHLSTTESMAERESPTASLMSSTSGSLAWNGFADVLARIYELPKANNRIPSMEGARGLAVILVFFVHYHYLFSFLAPPRSPVTSLSQFLSIIGHSGVDLFFVLSGYLIYGALIKKSVGYFAFVRRRARRIYPAFLCMFGVYLVLSFLFPSKSKLPPGFLPSLVYVLENLLLLPGMFSIPPIITVAWSLSYELFYYLSIPLVIRLTGMQRWAARRRVVFFVGLICLYACCSLLFGAPRFRLMTFVAGILVYEALQWRPLLRRLTSARESNAAGFVVLSFGLVYLLGLPEEYGMLPGSHWYGPTARALVLLVSLSVFSIFCLGFQGRLSRLCTWTPLRWLGNISYSFYLIHGLTLQAIALGFQTFLPRQIQSAWVYVPLFGVAFALSVIVATALFVAVERPFSLARHAVRPQLVVSR